MEYFPRSARALSPCEAQNRRECKMRAIPNRCVFILLLAVLFTGCASEKKHWENVKQINTTLAYENYLNKYPQSTYSDSARTCLEKLSFKQAQHIDSIPAYKDFLIKYPQSIYADSAQILLEALCYRQAVVKNTVTAFQEFIKKCPLSKLVPQAKDKIRNIELLKECPFDLIAGKPVNLRNQKAGSSLTMNIAESNLKSLETGGWVMQGIEGRLLTIKQKNYQIFWTDQPFQISYNGKILASFRNTAEYWKMLNE